MQQETQGRLQRHSIRHRGRKGRAAPSGHQSPGRRDGAFAILDLKGAGCGLRNAEGRGVQLPRRQHTFSAVVQPELNQLAQTYGATVIGVEASGLEHMIVVALARSDSPLRVHVDIGSRFPALISATGRCVAAFSSYPRAEIQARFARLRWDNPPALTAWWKEVRAARSAGYAVDDGQYIRGVTIVAAPVRMPNGSINALVVVGVSEQIRRVGLTAVGKDLHARAVRISRSLGGETLTGDS